MSRQIATNGLTVKQEQFCIEYVRTGGNASEAYRLAYGTKGANEATVNKRGFELVGNPKIAGRIDALRQRACDRAEIQEADVLREIARLGFSDASELFDDNNRLLPIKQLPPAVRAAIASIEFETRFEGTGADKESYTVTKIKLWDKNSALDKLCKHIGSYERDNRQKVGLLDALPREALELIKERLREFRRPVLVGEVVRDGEGSAAIAG